jgi:hypothetical protein
MFSHAGVKIGGFVAKFLRVLVITILGTQRNLSEEQFRRTHTELFAVNSHSLTFTVLGTQICSLVLLFFYLALFVAITLQLIWRYLRWRKEAFTAQLVSFFTFILLFLIGSSCVLCFLSVCAARVSYFLLDRVLLAQSVAFLTFALNRTAFAFMLIAYTNILLFWCAALRPHSLTHSTHALTRFD